MKPEEYTIHLTGEAIGIAERNQKLRGENFGEKSGEQLLVYVTPTHIIEITLPLAKRLLAEGKTRVLTTYYPSYLCTQSCEGSVSHDIIETFYTGTRNVEDIGKRSDNFIHWARSRQGWEAEEPKYKLVRYE